ncbi:MAG: hypothetical protein M1830_008652 [Pleopsidium flavum]|nr:MAG: hypothetical protein M1830_008652 [Pleopsidium flavum]
MSDDEDHFDDDEYLYIEDGPVAEAVSVNFSTCHVHHRWLHRLPSDIFSKFCMQDDLAEHTMHSPVWQEYDPSYDLTEFWSDWEYYSDDYYDEEPARKEKSMTRIRGGTVHTGGKRKTTSNDGGRWKRRRLEPTADIPATTLDHFADSGAGTTTFTAPIVLWRSKESPQREPLFQQGNGERVALLKDWREIFGPNTYQGKRGSHMMSNKRILDPGIETQLLAEDHDVERKGSESTELELVGTSGAGSASGRDMLPSSKLGSKGGQVHVTGGSNVGHSSSTITPKSLLISGNKKADLDPNSSAAPVGESSVFMTKSKNASGAKRIGSEAELDSIECKSQRKAPSMHVRDGL